MSDFLVQTLDFIGIAAALILAFVIRQAVNDLHLNRTDPPSVAKARKMTFYAGAGYIMLTLCFQHYWLLHPTVVSVAIVVSGYLVMCISILSVSMVSMALRKPPTGHRFYEFVGHLAIFGKLARIVHRSPWARDK